MAQNASFPFRRKCPVLVVIVLLAVGFAGLRLGGEHLEGVVKAQADRVIANYSAFVTIDYGRITVGLFDRAIHVTDITILPPGTDIPMRIGELVLHRVNGESRIPRQVTVSAKSVTWPGLRAYLDKTLPGGGIPGMEPLSVDLFLDYTFEPNAQAFHIRQLTIRGRDLGTVSLAAGIGNFVLENAALYLIMPHAIVFEGLSLVYTDDSLVSRWIAARSVEEGVSPKAYTRALEENFIRDSIRARQEGKPVIADALAALTAFLNRPDHLIFEARPEDPVPLGRLMRVTTFEEFVDLLDVRVAANRY